MDGIISGTQSRDIIISSCILRCFGDQILNGLGGGKMILGQDLFDHGAWEWIVMRILARELFVDSFSKIQHVHVRSFFGRVRE